MKLTEILRQLLEEQKKKEDRCKRIADRRYDKPSAYKSGAIVRCRQGKIWKDLKENNNNNQKHIIYPNFQGLDPAKTPTGIEKEINVKDAIGNEPNKNLNYFQTEKKDYVENMIKSAQNNGWKNFPPIIAIKHPLLPGKFLVIDGNHRLGAFKIGGIPKIKAIIVNDNDILLAIPGTKWQEGKTPETINLTDAKGKVNFKDYFATKDLEIPTNLNEDEDLSTKNNYIDAEGMLDFQQIQNDLIKIKPYYKSSLPNYLNGEPLTDDQIDQLIEIFTDNEADIFDSDWMTDADKLKFNQRWLKADIDDLNDWFVSFVEGLADNWEEYPLNEDESLHKWFKRKGTPGKEGGWVDCNTCHNGKCKPCGRKEGEDRAKYPSCRPTPSQCKTKGKGKKWGKTK